MATSSAVSAGDTATAAQYNNLRTDALTRELFASFTHTTGTMTYLDNYAAAKINSNEDAYCTFVVPDLYSSVTEAVVVVVPDANANTSWDIDIDLMHAAADEAYNTHTATDNTATYDYSTDDNKIKEIDISGSLSALAAGDYVGVTVENNEADELYCLGVRVKWSG